MLNVVIFGAPGSERELRARELSKNMGCFIFLLEMYCVNR